MENYMEIDMPEYFFYMADERKAVEIEEYIKNRCGENFLVYFLSVFVVATVVFFEEVLNMAGKDRNEVFLSLMLHIFSYFVEYGADDEDLEVRLDVSAEEVEKLIFEMSGLGYSYFDLLYVAKKYFGPGIVIFIYNLDFFRGRLANLVNFGEIDEILMKGDYDA